MTTEPASTSACRVRGLYTCCALLTVWVAAAQAYGAQPLATITVTETVEIERGRWPIVARVTLERAAAESASLTDARGDAVAFEVLDIHARESGEKPPSEVDVCFFVELQPGRQYVYTLRAGNRARAPAVDGPRIKVTGKGFGQTIDTGPARFDLDPLSGQLLRYALPLTDGDLPPRGFYQRKDRPIHWNPDVWAPPRRWGHVSDWDARRNRKRPLLTVSSGTLAYRSVRHGVMPNSRFVEATVSYTMFAGMPFVLESSRMHFTADARVKAVRNNQLVFSRGVHTHAIWADKATTPATQPIYDKKDHRHFLGVVRKLPPDVPWLGMFHDDHRYGIGIVNLEYHNTAPDGSPGPRDEDAHYYFLDYGEAGAGAKIDMNFAYFCRPVVFQYTIPVRMRKQPVMVSRGTIYAERSAILTFRLGDDEAHQFDGVLRWTALLRQPPTVTVD
ncbi:MAG: hypothetical protein CMJ49_02065 [Planctomycetaceae bacterium]|nr:hypothetical protein [Planctomycetaceae bacterium]